MIKLSLDLSKYRLDLHLVKRRRDDLEDPLIPSLEEIKNTRSGSKFSRFFRHIFEHKNIKKILGANLAVMVIATSFIPNRLVANADNSDNEVISIQKTQLKTEHGMQLPVQPLKINQGYWAFHPGVDLGGEEGNPIKPIMAGIVEDTQYSKYDYGNAIIINHGNEVISLYAHLSKINVKKGDEVTHDTVIGLMGETGHATGPHLHLEIRNHGYPINPLSVLPQ